MKLESMITVFDFKIKTDKGQNIVYLSIPWLDKPHIEISLHTFFNEVVKGEKIFYKKDGVYRVYVPLDRFMFEQNMITIDVLISNFGSIEEICPKFSWKLFWYNPIPDQTDTNVYYDFHSYEGEENIFYYLANGDDSIEIGNDLSSFCKKYNLTQVASLDEPTVLEGYPRDLIQEGYTDLSTLVYHIETCNSEEIWIDKLKQVSK